MATLKQRLHRKNSSGTYDTIHLETSADLIVGTLGITHGGTGCSTESELQRAYSKICAIRRRWRCNCFTESW